MPELTKEYIAEHRSGIHTYDSFGRALIERVCQVAEERIGKKPVQVFEIDDIGFYLGIVYQEGVPVCLNFCVRIGRDMICKHERPIWMK